MHLINIISIETINIAYSSTILYIPHETLTYFARGGRRIHKEI